MGQKTGCGLILSLQLILRPIQVGQSTGHLGIDRSVVLGIDVVASKICHSQAQIDNHPMHCGCEIDLAKYNILRAKFVILFEDTPQFGPKHETIFPHTLPVSNWDA
jgi:hypothetical protein